MKNLIIPVIAALGITASGADAMHGEEIQINVVVSGQRIEFEDQRPVIINGRTLLPIRNVMEALGKTVSWDSEHSRAVVSDGATTVSLGIGDHCMWKSIKTENGETAESIELDTAPIILNDRTCLPIRAVAESFGAYVGWDEATRTVEIN